MNKISGFMELLQLIQGYILFRIQMMVKGKKFQRVIPLCMRSPLKVGELWITTHLNCRTNALKT